MDLTLKEVADGLDALRERAGVSKTELARRMGVVQSTVSKMVAGRSLTLENVLAWLAGVEADLQDLATELGEAADDGGGPVSRLTGLDHAPRAVDLHEDARRILAEAERLQAEDRSKELDRAVQTLRLAVEHLHDVVERAAGRAWAGAEAIADAERPPARMSDDEFERALRLLKTMVKRAVAEEGAEKGRSRGVETDGAPAGDGER